MGADRARIFIVDDVREWLINLINQTPDLIVCREAAEAKTALPAIEASRADLAIIDLSLVGSLGIDLLRSIRTTHPNVAMIVLSMHDERVYAERCIRAGARGTL